MWGRGRQPVDAGRQENSRALSMTRAPSDSPRGISRLPLDHGSQHLTPPVAPRGRITGLDYTAREERPPQSREPALPDYSSVEELQGLACDSLVNGHGADNARYKKKDTLRAALSGGDVKLVKGDWLISAAKKNLVPPRCQDLPVEAVWTVVDHPWDMDIVAISYRWVEVLHPDPRGEYLRGFIGPMLAKYVAMETGLRINDNVFEKAKGDKAIVNWWDQEHKEEEIAVFWDWCSLPQAPRQNSEAASFHRAFKDIDLWYAHANTTVWLITAVGTVVPPDAVAYDDRGWPYFERSISNLLTPPSKRLNFGSLSGDWKRDALPYHSYGAAFYNSDELSDDSVVKFCQVSREPPLTPVIFATRIAQKTFTHRADRVLLVQKYAEAYNQAILRADQLIYNNLGWQDQDLERFAKSLAFCRTLVKLDLSSNRIQYIEVGTFDGLRCLQELHLHENGISQLGPQLFRGLHALTTLDLKCNNLDTVPVSVFCELGALKSLDLQKNHISYLRTGTFKGLISLQKLELGSNPIAKMDARAFDGLDSLKQLILIRLKIDGLKPMTFAGLHGLTKLEMQYNHIGRLDAGVFDGLPKLETLFLRNNHIAKVNASAFSNLLALNEIRLNGNPIENKEKLERDLKLSLPKCRLSWY